METNVRRYAAYQAARNLLLWLPVFVLYLSRAVPLSSVLVLEAIYYAMVVALEVPSGYASDRFGRRPTLVVGNLCGVAAGVVFATSSSFAGFAVAQGLLAASMAFNSGTDGALLYDSLDALGRADTFVRHEGRAQAWGWAALGVSALAGGLVAAWDMRAVYVVSAAAAAAAALLAASFVEPPRTERAARVGAQLRAAVGRLRDPWLRWTFAFAVAMTVFDHVPYELAQPYLALVVSEAGHPQWVEPAAGVVTAVAMMASAVVAARADRFMALGARRALLIAMALQGSLIAVLGIAVQPALAIALLVRSVPGALHGPIVQAVAHPRLSAGLRATFLSLQSLAGRLAFALSLCVASAAVGGEATTGPVLLALARGFAVAFGVVWLAFVVIRPGPRTEG